MDPNANLEEQLDLAREIQEIIDRQDPDNHDLRSEDWPRIAECAEQLADGVLLLDEWRRKGGFDPYEKRDGSEIVKDTIVATLRERGAQLAADRLDLLDASDAWEAYFGPLTDRIEEMLA